jgi:quinol monooxygenase YgiN
MVNVALLVRLEAKPGKEEDVANFLRDALPLVQAEPATRTWFAVRFDVTNFAIFDAFPDESGREDHLGGQVAAALMAKAPELFANTPVIELADVLAAKLPGEKRSLPRGEKIPMQVGSELHIHNNGEISLGNPEVEVGLYQSAADATLSYRFDSGSGIHVIRLLEPVADRQHLRDHRPND